MRTISFDPKVVESKYTLAISQGGTGASTQKEAVQNLGGIWGGSINQPGGFVGLDANGFIDKNLIPQDVSFGIPINIKGPRGITLNAETRYEITNYDSFTEYKLKLEGCTGYQSGQYLYIKAIRRGSVSFTVNGSAFVVDVLGNNPVNFNIVGGTQIGKFGTTYSNANLGTCVRYTDTDTILVGQPGFSSSNAGSVGRIDLVDESGAILRTILGEAGALDFSTTIETGGKVTVTTDIVGVDPIVSVATETLSVPSGTSTLKVVGAGAPGRTSWIKEILGTPAMALSGSIVPNSFKIEIESIKSNPENTVTTTYNTVVLAKTDITKLDVVTSVLETHSASSDQNASSTKMNIRGGPSSTTIEILNGPTAYDVLRLRVKNEQGVVVGSPVLLTFISTNATTGFSTYTATALYRTREGARAGYFSHGVGADTIFEGYERSLVWKGGLGDPEGMPMPRLGGTFFGDDHRVLIEFKYSSHGLSSSPSVLTTPFTAGSGLLAPIVIGSGRDTIDREIRWTLRNQATGSTIRDANGEIKMEFLDNLIRLTPKFSGVVWQNPPTSAVLVIEHGVSGVSSRSEFPMTQVLTDGLVSFEVSGFSYAKNGKLDPSFKQPETSSIDLKTSSGNRFGELFDIAPIGNTLVVGVKKDALSEKGAVHVFQSYDTTTQEEMTQSRLAVQINSVGDFTLGSISISEEGDFIAAGYPKLSSGVVGVFKKVNGFYTQLIALKADLADNAEYGASVQLTPQGKRIIIGCPGINRIRVYEIGATVTLKSTLVAPTGYTRFGRYTRVTANGSRLAVSALNAQGRGVVLIYDITNTPALRSTINQPTGYSNSIDFGITFDMSPDGSVIAVAAPANDSIIGRVFLFFNGTATIEHYKTLGEVEANVGSRFGYSVALKSDGTKLAVGVPKEPLTGEKLGQVFFYGGRFSFIG